MQNETDRAATDPNPGWLTAQGAVAMIQPALNFDTPKRPHIPVRHADIDQSVQLARVSAKIAPLVLEFFATKKPGDEFHINELTRWVWAFEPLVAADSPRRVMSELASNGLLAYKNINRPKSLYRVLALGGAENTGSAL